MCIRDRGYTDWYLASVRSWSEGEIEHKIDEAKEFWTNILETIAGTSTAIVLSHMAAYMSCGTARCCVHRGMVDPQLGVLYV